LNLGGLEGPQLSIIALVWLSHFHFIGIASVGALGHGQSLSGLGAHDLVLPGLVGGDDSPFSIVVLAGLSLVVQLGDWSLLLVLSQGLGLSIFDTVEDEAVVFRVGTLLGNKNLVPWGTVSLTESDDV
jgi:hypothetical protein